MNDGLACRRVRGAAILETRAVILDDKGCRSLRWASIATWTNLSETTFVLPPERGGDYRLRIFTAESGACLLPGIPRLAVRMPSWKQREEPSWTLGPRIVGLAWCQSPSPQTRTASVGPLSFEAPPVSATELPATAAQELLRALGAAVPARPEAMVMTWDPLVRARLG